ncbi:unnamed protein product [Symbiodinium sp. CCMP2592]|nr:unnamed protein product [Symbiodinium sp. CCMP2592]
MIPLWPGTARSKADECFVASSEEQSEEANGKGVVHGLDPRHLSLECALELQDVAARRGVLIFPRLPNLTGAELLQISQRFGSGEVVSRHVAHPESPEEEILRLSNQAAHGVVGVGPQWHHDGSTERRVFSHLLFHAQQMPATGGETDFADLDKYKRTC